MRCKRCGHDCEAYERGHSATCEWCPCAGKVIRFPVERRRVEGTLGDADWLGLLLAIQRELESMGPGRVRITVRIEHTSNTEGA